jgi:hypothetical protein
MFIAALAPKWPVWAERQRSNARKAATKLHLSALIEDITDKARTKEKSKAAESSALYGNKPEKDRNNKKDKDRKKDNKNTDKSKDKPIYGPCPHCSSTNSNHKHNSCFGKKGNKEKRKEWEEKKGRKWKGFRTSTKEKESKVVNDEDDDSHFGLVAMPSHLFNTNPDSKTNGWLTDTGATDHITYDMANFLDYTEMNNLDMITTFNGPVRPKGMGTVQLRVPLTSGKIKTIELLDCLYMPNCPINLFSAKKLYNAGGYIKDGRLWTKTDKEICQIDKRLLIIEEKDLPPTVTRIEGEGLITGTEDILIQTLQEKRGDTESSNS